MKQTLEIEGMNCNHCVEKITRFVSDCEGVKSAVVSLESKTLEVEFDAPASLETIIDAVEDAGFSVKN